MSNRIEILNPLTNERAIIPASNYIHDALKTYHATCNMLRASMLCKLQTSYNEQDWRTVASARIDVAARVVEREPEVVFGFKRCDECDEMRPDVHECAMGAQICARCAEVDDEEATDC